VSRIATLRKEDGTLVCQRCLLADNPWLRMKGLLGRSRLDRSEGILLRPASAIHMAFMRFAIDAVFADRDLRVLRVAEQLKPWRLASCRRARVVVELAAGTCAEAGLRAGDVLVLEPLDG
jgi:uncharacterized membrane protein (UPF0127 family)